MFQLQSWKRQMQIDIIPPHYMQNHIVVVAIIAMVVQVPVAAVKV